MAERKRKWLKKSRKYLSQPWSGADLLRLQLGLPHCYAAKLTARVLWELVRAYGRPRSTLGTWTGDVLSRHVVTKMHWCRSQHSPKDQLLVLSLVASDNSSCQCHLESSHVTALVWFSCCRLSVFPLLLVKSHNKVMPDLIFFKIKPIAVLCNVSWHLSYYLVIILVIDMLYVHIQICVHTQNIYIFIHTVYFPIF